MSRLAYSRLITGLVLAALALAEAVPPQAAAAGEPAQRVIVVYRNAVDDPVGTTARLAGGDGFRPSHVFQHAIRGFAATLPAAVVARLQSDPNVAYVEPDLPVRIVDTQTNATWGLDRIDQPALPLNNTYVYDTRGTAVTAYVIDTGIRTTHQEFGSRALHGRDTIDGSLPADDCHGHGTHVAGTIGGTMSGVAKDVTLVAVRVLNCQGSGSTSEVVAGIDWVTADHDAGEPAVANLSLGGGASVALDTAVRNSIADGVTYAIAAGNSNANACNSSPARVGEAMTIAASNANDARASFSNYGDCVDWFAPGVNITSAWSTSNTATNTISGTSMAAPHTAGAAALYLEVNPTADPVSVRQALFDAATKDIITSANTANNHLLYSRVAPAGPDTTPPTITSATPANGATAPPSTNVGVTFSEPMDPASAEAAFSINPAVGGSFSWTDNTMTFDPTADLAGGTTYTATVGTGATDVAGNPIASAESWSFTITATTSAAPGSVTLLTGTRRSGSAADLASDDNVYYEVNSNTAGNRTAAWRGNFLGIPNSLLSLSVSYSGKNSRSCTQTIAIWRWTDSRWVQLDSRSVGTSETAIANLVPGGTLAAYVSGSTGSGEVRIRVRCRTTAGTFVSSGDLLKITFG